jgi:integrase/recombinase XerD
MTDPPTEAVAVLVDAPLARPGERPKANPAQVYVASLRTKQSRQTAVTAMGRLLSVFGHPEAEWWTFPWWKVTAQETTIAQDAILVRYSPSTSRLTMCVLRRLLLECYRLELMTADVYHRAILLPKIKAESAPVGRMLKAEEVHALVDRIDGMGGDDYGAMAGAVFAAALGGGLRREELAVLPVTAFSADGSSLRVMGKGQKVRDQRLPAWASARIRTWLERRGERASSPTMFLRTQGFKLKDHEPSVWSIWSLIVATGRSAGVAPFTPHDLRRTFASRMLDVADLSITRKAMGHKSASTTARYDRRDDDRMAEAIDKLEGYGF